MPSLAQEVIRQTEAEQHADTIAKLRALDDAALMEKIGLKAELTKMRELLDKADALEGEKREKVNARLDERLHPRVHSYDIDYMIGEDGPKASCC